MKWRFLLPVFLVSAGIWIWQESVFSALKDQEQSLRNAMRRSPPPPPPSLPSSQPAPSPEAPPPDAKTIAQSLIQEYLALLPKTGRRAGAAQAAAMNRKLELLTAQSPAVLREALDVILQQDLSRQTARTLRNAVLSALSVSDPGACLRYFDQHPDETTFMEERRSGWLKKWAVKDPAAARQWYEEMQSSGQLKDMEFMSKFDKGGGLGVQLLCGRAASDLGAFDFHELEGLNKGSIFRFAADIPSQLKTPAARELYTRRVWNEVTDAKTAEQLLSLATMSWARRVPFKELKELTEKLEDPAVPSGAEKQKILSAMRSAIVKETSGTPEDSTLAWALQGAVDPAVRAQVIGGVVSGWMKTDFERTGNYVQALPSGPDRDQAILMLTRGLGDSEASLKWAASISDPVLRTKTEERIRKEMAIDYSKLPRASQVK